MFADKVAAMEHDLISPHLFHALSPTCVARAVMCGVEHLCVVVITLMIPAMGYYRCRQKGTNLTSSKFKFQPCLEYSISGEIFTSFCVTFVFLCEDEKQNACWTVRFEGCTFLLLPIRLPWWAPVCIQTCDRSEGPIGGRPPPPPPKVPDAWFGTNAHKHKRTWETPSLRMHVWICAFSPSFAS